MAIVLNNGDGPDDAPGDLWRPAPDCDYSQWRAHPAGDYRIPEPVGVPSAVQLVGDCRATVEVGVTCAVHPVGSVPVVPPLDILSLLL